MLDEKKKKSFPASCRSPGQPVPVPGPRLPLPARILHAHRGQKVMRKEPRGRPRGTTRITSRKAGTNLSAWAAWGPARTSRGAIAGPQQGHGGHGRAWGFIGGGSRYLPDAHWLLHALAPILQSQPPRRLSEPPCRRVSTPCSRLATLTTRRPHRHRHRPQQSRLNTEVLCPPMSHGVGGPGPEHRPWL